MTQKHVLQSVNHHECRLGKWYDGEGKVRFGKTNNFSLMKEPHAAVHQKANKNLEFIDLGDNGCIDHAKEIVSNFQEMEKESERLFVYMDNMLLEG